MKEDEFQAICDEEKKTRKVIGPKKEVWAPDGMFGRAFFYDHFSAKKAKKVLEKKVNQ